MSRGHEEGIDDTRVHCDADKRVRVRGEDFVEDKAEADGLLRVRLLVDGVPERVVLRERGLKGVVRVRLCEQRLGRTLIAGVQADDFAEVLLDLDHPI